MLRKYFFRRFWPKPVCILASAITVIIGAVPTQAVERTTLKVPVADQTIDVHIYRPEGSGPFPLLVMSHGSPRHAEKRVGYGAETFQRQAQAYAALGVLVAVPIRRGYGGSGQFAEGYGTCSQPDYRSAGLATAADILAAIRAAQAIPAVDPSRVVLLGQSAGGWGSIAASSVTKILGVVNFAGGRGSKKPLENCDEGRLIDAAAMFGRTASGPQLWIYSLNDQYFGAELPRRMHAAFTSVGGRAQFLQVPTHGEDGHRYVGAIASWKPNVDRFLKEIGFLR